MYEYGRRKNDEAMEIFKLYLDCTDGALFQKQNQNVGLVAYYVSLLSFGKEDYDNAKRYADVALKDANFAHDAAEIKINCMSKQLVTKADSVNYVADLMALYDKAPENTAYFKMLADYFLATGHECEVSQFAILATQKHPENKMTWMLKGETEQKKKCWINAIDSYKRVLGIDSIYAPAAYNIGKCYFNEAKSLNDSLHVNRLKQRKADEIKYRALMQNAKKWIVKASLLDPKLDATEREQMLEYINKVIG
jgi:hypothetical protein